MAGRSAPRPKAKRAGTKKTTAHTTHAGRDHHRVRESQKHNKGPAV